MQAQRYSAFQLHTDYYDDLPHSAGTSQHNLNPYISTPDATPTFTTGFSRGSSFTYPNQDHHYAFNRGEFASRLYSTSMVDRNSDATGSGFAGNPSLDGHFGSPEDNSACQPPSWDWPGTPNVGIVAPAPLYAPAHTPSYLGARNQVPPFVARSPTTQLPTRTAMAIHLNPHVRSDGETTQSGYEVPPESPSLVVDHSPAVIRPIARQVEPAVANQGQGAPEPQSREKKHACTMCHKRFDRPSTLRKHLLVHTGEKAFVCEICGRRFGVASNLNRHVKRHPLKSVGTMAPMNNSSSESPTSSIQPCETSQTVALMPPSASSATKPPEASTSSLGKRSRGTRSQAASSASGPSSSSTSGSASGRSKPSGTKRRRRAPSPSRWIPETLQSFQLASEDAYRATTVPLPPVRRNPPNEERDSWDENTAPSPYHPDGWNGVLPGPGFASGFGLGGRDLSNMNLGGRGGFMLGRVMVF